MYKITFEAHDIMGPDNYRWKPLRNEHEHGGYGAFETLAEAKEELKERLKDLLDNGDDGCGDADCSYELVEDSIDTNGSFTVRGCDWDGDWCELNYTIEKL